MAQIFDQEKVGTEFSAMQDAIKNIKHAIEFYPPIAYSLIGSSEDIIGSVEGKLSSIKDSYTSQLVPVLDKIEQNIDNASKTYGIAITNIK